MGSHNPVHRLMHSDMCQVESARSDLVRDFRRNLCRKVTGAPVQVRSQRVRGCLMEKDCMSERGFVVDSLLLCHSWLFKQLDCCQGKPDFGTKSECMSAENLCTTYYLVLLFSMWTPALRCGVYLFTCLCLTLCALHRHSLLCYFQFGWWIYGWVAHFNLSHILVNTFFLYHWSSLWSCPFLAHPHIFLYFDTDFDYIYCPSYSVSQSFLNWF